jgi:hypothetical protein
MSASAPEHQNGFRRRSEDLDVLLPLLQRLHTVRNLPDAAQRALCAVARAVKYQQGEYIYRKDDLSDSSYIVLTGERCGSWQKTKNCRTYAVFFPQVKRMRVRQRALFYSGVLQETSWCSVFVREMPLICAC